MRECSLWAVRVRVSVSAVFGGVRVRVSVCVSAVLGGVKVRVSVCVNAVFGGVKVRVSVCVSAVFGGVRVRVSVCVSAVFGGGVCFSPYPGWPAPCCPSAPPWTPNRRNRWPVGRRPGGSGTPPGRRTRSL